jgi:3-deoxy-D-manno-octulosonate 8-phosphate phosphatase (KDO 8-P phosphatase)
MAKSKGLKNKLSKITFFLFDVDGVLSDGRIIIGNNGVELKNYDVKDGVGISLAEKLGFKFGILSGRYSKAITLRAKELRIGTVYQDIMEKGKAYEKIKQELGLKDENICFIGDDIIDLPVLAKCGFSAAPSDAVAEVKKAVDYTAKAKGGRGAVREIIEVVLKGQGAWQKAVNKYLRYEV